MARNSKNTQNVENQKNLEQAQETNETLENLEQANENQENLEQAEETKEQPKPNTDSLAVEAKGFSESEEFKVGKANPVKNTDETQVIIRF